MSMQRYNQALIATLKGLRTSLARDLPDQDYRRYYEWALSEGNPNREAFLQAMGISQLIQLTLKLLDGTVEERNWPRLVEHSVVMNVYQVYEIVSDNLAIGLTRRVPGDATSEQRRELLLGFNGAMIDRLSGRGADARVLMAPFKPVADKISAFDQSLIAEKHKAFATSYLAAHPGASMGPIEYSIWPVLVANIESCAVLVEFMKNCRSAALINDGLIKRYSAVNTLLRSPDLTPEQRGKVGADAILVMPTLAYYVAAIAEVVEPAAGFERVVEDGTLPGALHDAALLVRMVNDLGKLVLLGDDEISSFMASLKKSCSELSGSASQIHDFLLTAAKSVGPLLTRVNKDVAHGEFNLCVDGLASLGAMGDALEVFGDRLRYYASLYSKTKERLKGRLARTSQTLGRSVPAELIGRFVQFHEFLYSNPYTEGGGEYAI